MIPKKLLELTRTREGKTDYPYLVMVKYSRQPIPIIYGMTSKEEAEEFAANKRDRNRYVRWVEIQPQAETKEAT